MSKITTKNTIFYSTANAGYAVYAAASLLSIRDSLPDAKLFIISSGLSDYDRKILDGYNIGYHEVDFSEKFTQVWEYPIDCYYLFAGPELFYDQGYEYSVYIDGDVLCLGNPIEEIVHIECVAGVVSAEHDNKSISIFGDDWEEIAKIWRLPEETETRRRINSGVVYFNNKQMADINMLDKAAGLFKKSLEHNIPRKGDDSLFSLFQYVYMKEEDVEILSPTYNYVLQFNEWNYPVDGLIFFHFSVDKPWKRQPYRHDNRGLDVFNPYVKLWRSRLRRTAPLAWLDTLVFFGRLSKIARSVSSNIKRLLKDQLLYMRGLKKSYFTRIKNSNKIPLKLFWWQEVQNNIKNFGDEITGDIIRKIFGYQYSQSSIQECEMIGAGSLLEIAAQRDAVNTINVWGSGYINDNGHDNHEGLVFYAVRGRLTQQRVGDNSVVLGDPGLLASVVYPKARYRSSKIGVVVHYADSDLPIVEKIKKDPRFVVINPLSSPTEVAKSITGCRFIFSSSLHGLIFADSYGVPNIHLKLSDRLTGGIYKFRDYYSATARQYKVASQSDMFNEEYIDALTREFEPVKGIEKIQKKLIRSFPNLR